MTVLKTQNGVLSSAPDISKHLVKHWSQYANDNNFSSQFILETAIRSTMYKPLKKLCSAAIIIKAPISQIEIDIVLWKATGKKTRFR